MSFLTPSSTALGWGNFLTDYLSGNYPPHETPVDALLDQALNDAQNGLNGAVIGGTIYFPPLSGTNFYPLSGTHTITGSCALVSTNALDTEFAFGPPGDYPTTTTAFIIEGANVTLQGFRLTYAAGSLSPTGGNVPAIQVVSTSGVVLEDVIIYGAYGGVDCVASSMVCDRVEVYNTPSLAGLDLPQLPPYGFCAEPGDANAAQLAGLTMIIRNSKVDPGKGASGMIGYLLIPPYPEMAIDQAGPKHTYDAFHVLTGAGTAANSGIMRVRNTSCESDVRSMIVEGGSVVQTTHLNNDNVGVVGNLFTAAFTGVALIAGNHYGSSSGSHAIEFGVSADDPTISGGEQPISALLSVIGSSASASNIFLSMTASGSAVINTVAASQSGPSIQIGGMSQGPATVVGSSLFTGALEVTGGSASPMIFEALTTTNTPAAISGAVTLYDSPPFNPAGTFMMPLPSGTPWTVTNDSGYDATVYLEPTDGLQITQIAVSGHVTGLSPNSDVIYPVAVPAGQELSLTFSATPNSSNFNWIWIAN